MNDNKPQGAPIENNPWSDPKNLPSLKVAHVIFFSLIVLACSLYPYVSHYKYAPYVACALGIAATLTFYRSTPGKLLLLIPAALLALGLGSFLLAAELLVLALSVALGALLLAICVKKHPRAAFLLLLLPAASFALAYVLSRSISLSLISVSVYPAIILLAFAAASNSSRVVAICHASLGFAIAGVTLVGVIVFRQYGAFSPDTLKVAIADARAFCTELLHRFFIENEELMKPIYEAAELTSYTDFISVELVVSSFFGYIPAIFIVICNVLGFFAQSGFTNALDKTFGTEKNKLSTLKTQKFVLSIAAAIVFLVAGIVQFIASCAGSELISLASESIYLILMPGFCISGFGTLLARIMTSKSKHKALIVILLVLFASCLLYPALTLLAISGAFNTISYHLFRFKITHTDDFK